MLVQHFFDVARVDLIHARQDHLALVSHPEMTTSL